MVNDYNMQELKLINRMSGPIPVTLQVFPLLLEPIK